VSPTNLCGLCAEGEHADDGEEFTCPCCGKELLDTASSNSRQHFIETGTYMTRREAEEWRSK
jgi:hypothetical protein